MSSAVQEKQETALATVPASSSPSSALSRTVAALPFNVQKMAALAKASAASGFYSDARDENKALVKMMVGHELGIGPGAALSGIYIVQNKVVLSANLMAALIKKSDRYNYRVKKLDDDGCILTFLEEGKSVGESAFTMADAQKAGLTNKGGPWKSFPRNMLFARALSNGIKWYCPDLTAGTPAYTPDEVGLEETEDGEVVVQQQTQQSSGTAPELVLSIKSLCEETQTPIQALLNHFQVSTLEQLGDAAATNAVKILQEKRSIQAAVARQAQQQKQPAEKQLHVYEEPVDEETQTNGV